MVTVRSAVLVGIESRPVTITARAGGIGLTITGTPDPAAREIRVRVKSSLSQCGIEPANVEVQIEPEIAYSSGLDLPIALAVAMELSKAPGHSHAIVVGELWGELSLTGKVMPVRGAIAHAIAAKTGMIIVPAANAHDAALSDATVLACSTLEQALRGAYEQCPPHAPELGNAIDPEMVLSDVETVSTRRALEISAAGNHSILLIGSPGSGKTPAARRLVGILPDLSGAEAIEVATIHDAAGLRSTHSRDVISRPFRAPHHTVSETGLLGGGDRPRPGEVTLAHHGVLFLDEVAEFRRSTIDALRRVLTEGKITLSRCDFYATMPAAPLLVGAVNTCGCGLSICKCSPNQLKSWRDRAVSYESLFTMRVTLPEITLYAREPGEPQRTVCARIEEARTILGSTIPKLHTDALKLLVDAIDRKIVARQRDVELVAKTIAALDGTERISPAHMAEAIALCAVRGGRS
jgi:magnesium chelatase family protein